MSQHIGVPGIGGSLGECQICGKSFIMEIVTGQKIASFTINNFPDQVLYAHKHCHVLIKDGVQAEELPDGPIRRALLKTNSEEAP